MAGLTHLGVGLAAKRVAPKTPLWALVVSAYALDFLFGVFWLLGIERVPGEDVEASSPYSHGLFMAAIWSALAGLTARRISRDTRTGWVVGLLTFSHWVVDFISHPMTAVFPRDTGLPVFFDDSPKIGLGVWRTKTGMNIGEYGSLIAGAVIYLFTLRKLKKEEA
ncbi:MAG: hypothetical protein JXB47_08490 [Anaerolineae bacterium]|nr:hypothetical protein [Anaerolineae bacterium]